VRKEDFAVKYLKIELDTDNLKIILLDLQNNYVENSRMMRNAAKILIF